MTKQKTPHGFPERIDNDVTVRDINLDDEEFYVGGERLTEQRADEYADRAQAGRPSLTAPGKRSPSLNLRVPTATRTRLDKVAAEQGRRPSDVARDALEEYLARQ